MRVALSLLALALIIHTPPLTAQETGGAWRVEESRSAMTDERTVTAILPAVAPIAGDMGPVRPAIIVRCREGALEAYVHTDLVLDGTVNGGARIRLRWDEQPPEVGWWTVSSSHQALFAPDPAAFLIGGLAPASQLRVEFTPFGSGPRVAAFRLRGFAAILPRLKAACPRADWSVATTPAAPSASRRGALPPDVRPNVEAAPAPPPAQTYFEFQVDKQVAPVPGNPTPHYPDTLRIASITGEVVAQFAVTEHGTADLSTFKVLKSSHVLFTAAVKAVLPQMRFLPAEIGGTRVRQLVQMPFVFSPSDVP